MKQPVSVNSNRSIVLLIGGFTVVAFVLIGFVAINEQKETNKTNQVTQYLSSDSQKPVAVFDTEIQDLGKIRVSDEKTAEFSMKNTGTKSLSLFNISSSCGCTAGVVTINGVKSPEGSMHTKNSWIGTLNPGESAVISVIYRPSVMPVKGDVSRSVSVETNDPVNKQLTFIIKAFVE